MRHLHLIEAVTKEGNGTGNYYTTHPSLLTLDPELGSITTDPSIAMQINQPIVAEAFARLLNRVFPAPAEHTWKAVLHGSA